MVRIYIFWDKLLIFLKYVFSNTIINKILIISFLGLYNTLAYGNYVVFTGDLPLSKLAQKLPHQNSNVIVINEDLSSQELGRVRSLFWKLR